MCMPMLSTRTAGGAGGAGAAVSACGAGGGDDEAGMADGAGPGDGWDTGGRAAGIGVDSAIVTEVGGSAVRGGDGLRSQAAPSSSRYESAAILTGSVLAENAGADHPRDQRVW